MVEINRDSDFKYRFKIKDEIGSVVAPDGLEWSISFYVYAGCEFIVSNQGGIMTHWVKDGDFVVAIFKDHNFCEGILKYKVSAVVNDRDFPDGKAKVVATERATVIKLV